MAGRTHRRMRCSLSNRVALLALALPIATEAMAQGAETAAVDQMLLEEIVVTAQKRSENIQDVPASVSVVGGEQLDNLQVTQLADIASYIPGFQVDSGGTPGQTTISLRGVAPIGQGQTVGIYLDDTPVGSSSLFAQASAFSLDLLPYDVERLEVLRGPQGTLYGASSIGGLLKYVTRAPDLQEFEIRSGGEAFQLESSDDLGWAARAGINAPLIPGELALRASYAHQNTPGYIDNLLTGKEDQNEYANQGGRMALLWQANDDISLRLSALWQSLDSDDNAIVAFTLPPPVALGNGRSNVNRFAEPFEKEFAHFGATLDWDLDFATFTSASSYSESSLSRTGDASATFGALFPLFGQPAGLSRTEVDLELEKWTQEFRLASPSSDRFEWLVGAFYTYEDSANAQLATAQSNDGASIPGLDPLVLASVPSTYEEHAAFANLTYRFGERFALTGGLRWARNEQEFSQTTSGAIVPGVTVLGDSSESVWTYSISPQFHASEDTMLYARVASGYRPGGPNVVLFGNPPPTVGSDELVNYEVGLKSEFLRGHAILNFALFRMDWDDIQVTVSEGGVAYLDNAGKARSSGAEASLTLRPIDNLLVSINGAYVDAKLRDDAPSLNGMAGEALPQIPQWSGSVTADYEFPLPGGWSGHAGAGLRFADDRPQEFRSDPGFVVAESYEAIDLNVDVTNGRWTARIYAKNLTDRDAVLSSGVVESALGQPVRVVGTPLQPRTIGLAIDVRY